tara:strand:+ start:303 stop:560 length:258 start_codon:yes stop_codon:yes gene_type:complete
MNDEEKFAYQWIGVATCFCVGIWLGFDAQENLIPYFFVLWLVSIAFPIYGLAEMNSPPTQAELDRRKLIEASKIQREKERQDEKK